MTYLRLISSFQVRRSRLKSFTGRIWPPGCSLPTPDIEYIYSLSCVTSPEQRLPGLRAFHTTSMPISFLGLLSFHFKCITSRVPPPPPAPHLRSRATFHNAEPWLARTRRPSVGHIPTFEFNKPPDCNRRCLCARLLFLPPPTPPVLPHLPCQHQGEGCGPVISYKCGARAAFVSLVFDSKRSID